MRNLEDFTSAEPDRHTAAGVLLDKTKKAGAAPPVAFQILALVRRDDYCAEDLIKLVQLDPELTAQLLSMVNTMEFRGRGVASLREAIMRLGTAAIADKALSLTTGRLLAMMPTAYVPDPAALWRHSVECALACRHLSRYCQRLPWGPDVVFTAGLLHDLGKTVINAAAPEEVLRIASVMRAEGLSSADAELSVLGVDHAEIGGVMLERWHLPQELSRAVQFHHAPEFDPQGLANLVHVGNCCAKVHAGSRGWAEFAESLHPYALHQLRLPLEQVAECWGEVLQDMDAIERFIAC